MSERSRWRDTVAELAEEAGLALSRPLVPAPYPEPDGDNAAVAYLRHLADNLKAIPANRVRHAAVVARLETATGDERADLEAQHKALDSEHEELLKVVARHGYIPAEEGAEARRVSVEVGVISQDEADVLEAKSRPARAKRAPSA